MTSLICGIENDINKLTYKTEKRLTDLGNELMVAGGGGSEGIVRNLGMSCTHCLLYLKWITTKIYCRAQGILLSVMCQPGWEWGLGASGYICMAEPFCCSPETITLLIGYTPIQNVFSVKKIIIKKKESACQCRGHRFHPWSGKIPQACVPQLLSPCSATRSHHTKKPTCHN